MTNIKSILLLLIIFTNSLYSQSWIFSTYPAQNQLNVTINSVIKIIFSEDINETTLNGNTIYISGSYNGNYNAQKYDYNASTRTLSIITNKEFYYGEKIEVILTTEIQNILGEPLPSPYIFNFQIQSYSGSGIFENRNINSIPTSYITSGDWDGDGDIDIATTNPDNGYSGKLSIWYNEQNGDNRGIFSKHTEIALGFNSSPLYIASADFNNDGDLDLAISCGGDFILLFQNDGNGNFSLLKKLSNITNPVNIETGDFNSDGYIDLAVCQYVNAGNLLILKNDKEGNYTSREFYHMSKPYWVNSCDYDNDGDLDLIVADAGAKKIKVMKNDSLAKFVLDTVINTSSAPQHIVNGDIDANGSIDFIVSLDNNASQMILMNDKGTFNKISYLETNSAARSNCLADLDGDGDLDLIHPNFYNNKLIESYKNNGKGEFTYFSTFGGAAGSSQQSDYVFAFDLDEDGDMDIIATANSGFFGYLIKCTNRPPIDIDISNNYQNIYFNKIKINQTSKHTIEIKNKGATESLVISNIKSSNSQFNIFPKQITIDKNRKATLDVYFNPTKAANNNDSLIIFSNDLDEPTYPIYVNGTGTPIIESIEPPSNATIRNNNIFFEAHSSSDLMANSITLNSFKAFGTVSGYITNADYNYTSDGFKANIIKKEKLYFGEDVQIILNDEVKSNPELIELLDGFTWGLRTGSTHGSQEYTLDTNKYNTSNLPSSLDIGDFNKDNFIDIAVTNNGSNSIKIYYNNKLKGFDIPVEIPVGNNPQGIEVADVNLDGYTDIIVSNSGDNNITVLLNDNGNSFNNLTYQVGSVPRDLKVADLDNDCDLDIAVINSADNNISILYNNGVGAFGNETNISVGESPSGITIKDFNNDGTFDIAVCNKLSNNVIVLFNELDDWKTKTYPVGTAPNDIIALDFNNDSFIDLAIANEGTNNISLLNNSGDSTFITNSNIVVGDKPISLYSNDLNSDGFVDLAVANYGSDNIMTFTNNDGVFNLSNTIYVGDGPKDIIGIDMTNKVGILDLLTVNLLENSISLIRNDFINTPPTIIKPIVSKLFPEDSGTQIISQNLNNNYKDIVDNDELYYSVKNNNEFIQINIENDSMLVVKADTNYYGQTDAILTITDKIDTIFDTIHVTISSINDYPRIFNLPDSLIFDNDSTVTLTLYDYVDDVETPDSLLTYRFSSPEKSVKVTFDSLDTSNIIISANNFSGVTNLYFSATDDSGATANDSIALVINTPVGIFLNTDVLPTKFQLSQNYPNPFNPETTIKYSIPQITHPHQKNGGQASRLAPSPLERGLWGVFVTLKIYDVLGKEIATLVNKKQTSGNYTVNFNAKNLPSGIYFYRLTAGSFTETKKMILMR